jgi:hypothetical protein
MRASTAARYFGVVSLLLQLAVAGCVPSEPANSNEGVTITLAPPRPKPPEPVGPLPYCETGDFPIDRMVSVGPGPLLILGRTGLDSALGTRGLGGIDATYVHRPEDVDVRFSLRYTPLRELVSGENAELYMLSMGVGWTEPEPGRAPGKWKRFYTHSAWGPSLMVLDMDGGDHDTVGIGFHGHWGVNVILWRRLGIEAYVDVHGWLARDSHEFALAGSSALGLGLTLSF